MNNRISHQNAHSTSLKRGRFLLTVIIFVNLAIPMLFLGWQYQHGQKELMWRMLSRTLMTAIVFLWMWRGSRIAQWFSVAILSVLGAVSLLFANLTSFSPNIVKILGAVQLISAITLVTSRQIQRFISRDSTDKILTIPVSQEAQTTQKSTKVA